MKPVAIVGGGLSGLAAGVSLSSRGIPVLLFEQRPFLGGRAYSFVEATTREIIDNGQHVLIAGYRRTLGYLERMGTRHLLMIQPRPRLVFHHPERGFKELLLPKLPSPLHLLVGMARCDLFTVPDRMRILRAGRAIQRANDDRVRTLAGATVDEWLSATGQSDETRRSLWEPLAVSIMNEHCSTASAMLFVRALRTAFFGGWQNAAFALPMVGLSELLVDPARSYIERHRGSIRCGADVTGLLMRDGRVSGLRVGDADEIECSACILAVPSFRVGSLLPEAGTIGLRMSMPERPELSPIVSIHLWFPQDFMPHEVVGVIGRRVQWVFNRRMVSMTRKHGGYISAVISAAHQEVDWENDELIRSVVDDLRSVYGTVVKEPTHAVVIREKRATFSPRPAFEHVRPTSQTPVKNLFLAGDWTDTGYPATIEGAVLSGERSADSAAEWLALQE